MTGVLLAVPGADFVLHNSLFLIAHFHNVIIGGVVFGSMAGVSYWFPKAMGFTLNEKWNKRAFWFWIIGFYVAFMPLYVLGFMGMTRRLSQNIDPQFHPLLVVAASGAALIACGILCQSLCSGCRCATATKPGYDRRPVGRTDTGVVHLFPAAIL